MTIKYKEKEYEFTVDFATISKVCQRAKIKFSQFNQEFFDDPANIELVFEEGLKRGCRKTSKEFDLTPVDLENILADNLASVFGQIKKDTGAPEPDSDDEDSKKN